jgi:pyridoxamine 5'-phosphate oxidase family protein
MRLLMPMLIVIVAVVLAYLVFVGAGRAGRLQSHRQRAQARWQVRHTGAAGTTTVGVALMLPSGEVLDEHVVETFPDTVQDWNDRFVRAKQEAEERAFHLNADT